MALFFLLQFNISEFSSHVMLSLRFYISVSLKMSVELLQSMFSNELLELSEMSNRKVKNCEEPIFNIVPVISAYFIDILDPPQRKVFLDMHGTSIFWLHKRIPMCSA
ncbi:hypothetical protein MtrunA17_Chr7g0253941 [Medicago truncatula]|uniref:Uncharacterized protein n=2 Tax=Medicago truncatula TaxID=3880 RepID=A0A396H2D9_MEDTR|nr:hypothetical protein MtrunA17_Chr7g0253941 [Medicago truncatula]